MGGCNATSFLEAFPDQRFLRLPDGRGLPGNMTQIVDCCKRLIYHLQSTVGQWIQRIAWLVLLDGPLANMVVDSLIPISTGQTVHFSFQLSGSTWTCTLSGPGSASTTISLSGQTMNRYVISDQSLFISAANLCVTHIAPSSP